MAGSKPTLTVRLEALGRETTRLENWKIESAYLVASDSFELTFYDTDRENLPGLAMQPVELLLSGSRVSGAQQALGRLDVPEGENGAVVCQGRDYIADLIECRVDPTVGIRKDTTLGRALLDVAAPAGIDTIWDDGDLQLRNLRTGKAPGNPAKPDFASVKLDDLKPQPSQGCYDFMNRQVARNGATIQPGTKRNELCLSVPDYSQAPMTQIRRARGQHSGAAGNVKTAKARRDYSSFQTYTLFTGKKVGGATKSEPLKYELDTLELAKSIGGELYETLSRAVEPGRRKPADAGPIKDGKLYRFFYQKDEEARTQEQLERVARRAIGELLKDTLVYTVSLQGHEDPETGAFWGVNTVIDVHDEIEDVNEPVWVASRNFAGGRSGGATTDLVCWRLGVFQL